MSYILDALSKSQQERARADVPTLATPFPVAETRRRAPGILVGVGLAALSAGVLVTAFGLSGRASGPGLSGGEASAPAPVLPAPITTEPSTTKPPQVHEQVERANLEVAAASANPVRAGAGGSERGTSDPTAALTAGRGPSPATQWLMKEISALDRKVKHGMVRSDESPAPDVRADTVASVPPDAEQPPSSPALDPALALAAPPGAVGPSVEPGQPVTPLRDLPPETRSAIPRLEVNVHSYSQDPERRMVLINMKRYGEGDRLAEGPLIQSITPTGVVLVHDRQRFSIPAR